MQLSRSGSNGRLQCDSEARRRTCGVQHPGDSREPCLLRGGRLRSAARRCHGGGLARTSGLPRQRRASRPQRRLRRGCVPAAVLQREQARRSTLCTALRAAPDRATHTARCTCTALRTALCTVLCIALPSAPPPAGAALGYRREQTCRAVRRPAAQRQPGEGRLRRASTRARGWRLASASGDSRGGCSVRSLTRAPTLIEQVRRQAAARGAIRGRLTAPTACWERRLGGAMTRCPWPPGADSPGARLRYALGTSRYAAVPLSPMGGSNTATSLHFAAFNAQAQLALCRRLL